MNKPLRTASTESEDWTIVIEPGTGLLDINLREIWQYRDLVLLIVRRDFVAKYTQTVLGPLWYLLQPLLTTVVFTVVFGNIAGISTDGLPKMLFYLAGVTPWGYFSNCLNSTAGVFAGNANLFGKVYFPRLVIPLSIVVSNLFKFLVQLLLFIGFYIYFFARGADIHPTSALLLFPLVMLLMAGLGLGFGMIITSMTTKYRDLNFLLGFAVSLMMYGTPIIYPLSTIPDKYLPLIQANPMTPVIETFRYATLGTGQFSWGMLGYSTACMLVLLFLGLIVFHRTEKNFMDTI